MVVLQIKDDPKHVGTAAWANFKCNVWHRAVAIVIETIKKIFGEMLECGNGIERLLFPFILILCADYKEQYVFLMPHYNYLDPLIDL